MFHRAKVSAPVNIVWDVLTEHEAFHHWTNIEWAIDRPGDSERNGLGCIRSAEFPGSGTGERLVEVVNIWQPHSIYGYHITSGIALEAHQGVVRFWPTEEGGCEWIYDLRIKPSDALLEAIPGFLDYVGGEFPFFMDDIEGECERRMYGTELPKYPLPVEEPLEFNASTGGEV